MRLPRSYLYVPGHRHDRFEKAVGSGADAVILDLEDAVPISLRDAARADVRAFLGGVPSDGVEIWVRINDGDRGRHDLDALSDMGALTGVVIPKARCETLAARRADAPDTTIIPLVESAAGMAEVMAIAGCDGVRALAIGEVDLGADLGLGDEVPEGALWALRMQVVVASAAAGRAAPLGPVVRHIEDLDHLRAAVIQLRNAGFGAMQAIHPTQVAAIHAVLTPTPDELAAAEELLQRAEQAAGGVFVGADGRMIDEAVLRSARRTLGRA